MAETMMTYIEQHPAVLGAIAHQYPQSLAPLADWLAQHQVNRILILATGSSLNAALCARYYFEMRFGILVEIKEPWSFCHYERIDPTTSLVLAISQSGKSASTIAAIEKVRRAGLPAFCLTSDPHSPAAQAAQAVLDIGTGIETVGFVTRGFSATVLNLLLIALLIAQKQQAITAEQAATERDEIQRLAAALPSVIDKTERFFTRQQKLLAEHARFVAVGYGALLGVAKEFETKFTETVRQPSSGFELEAYMHGPYLEASREHILFFIDSDHHPRLQALRDYMRPAVGAAFLVTTGPDSGDEQTLALDLGVSHHFAPLALIVPFQILAWRTAALKGIDLSVRIFDDFDRVLKSKI
ncbi:SIS domain-containing protein [Enterobacteriaceae bacterium BIT-l23]|uniref:SIS domain-containing protein n=1 Tax=Jejubacter sp. L23 TaxID=3092086 RepID=UPI001584E8DC|nr:SIS domain-containing protein [Enterobacteriaceae bacterium BIT-l23]